MSNLYDGVKWTAAAGGTAAFTVAAAVPSFLTPAGASVPNNTANIPYTAYVGAQREWGLGTYNAGVFTRNEVRGNSLGTTATINFSSPPTVFFDVQAEDLPADAISLPLPFFGSSNPPWSRPSLNIGGPSNTFNTWLNQGGQVYAAGASSYSNNGTGPAVAAGTHYAPGDTVTIAGGTGSPAVLQITDTQLVSAAIVNAGHSGTPGSAQVIGTTGAGNQLFILDVTIGGGGTITSINDINNAGDYTTNPTDLSNEPVADNSSSGITGAIVSVVMGALAAVPANSGAYSVNPSNPAGQSSSSGSGTGATWNLRIGAFATATDGANGAPLVLQAANGGVASYLTALLKPLGAEPWTVTLGVASVIVTSASKGATLPLVLYNSSAKKAFVINWSGNDSLQAWLYTNTDVPGASAFATPESFSWNISGDYFGWFKAQNDGTNITVSFSAENIGYLPFVKDTIANLGGPFDYVGIGLERVYINAEPATVDAAGGATGALSPLWNFTQTSP